MPSESTGAVFLSFPLLHTERLDLIEIRQEHLDDLFRLFGNYRVTQYYNIVPMVHKEEAQQLIDRFRSGFMAKEAIRWGIAVKGERHIIGTLGFNNFTPQHRANIGYDLQPQYWNQGIISEALKAIVSFGFQRLGINRIEAEVMPGNHASEKVLEKLGFVREGLLRDWMLWNGKHYDMTMFSLLNKDFQHLQPGW